MTWIGRLLSSSAAAEVFEWGASDVLKLYRAGASPVVVHREAGLMRAARAAGLPAPAVLDTITMDGRPGLIFERTHGPALLETILERPDLASDLGRRFAALHATVHARPGGDAPALRERLRARVAASRHLDESQRTALLVALDGAPDGEALCHGDFHPANVLMASNGPVIIDWFDATRGDPAADVARTCVILEHAEIPARFSADARRAVARVRTEFSAAYRARYAELAPDVHARVERWILPVAAARLAEPVSATEHDALLARVRTALAA